MPISPRTRAPLAGPRFTRGRTLVRRLLPAAVLLALLPAPAAAAASCSDFTNGTPSYTVRVCLTAPADGATLTGDTSVTATVATVAGTNPGVQRVVFSLDGQYLLTDFTSPYTFTLPTSKFVDGPRVIGADALLRDGSTTAPDATIQTTFATGTTTPPVNPNTFAPKVASPPPNTSLVVAAVGDGAGGEPSAADAVHLMSGWDPSLFLYLGDVYEKGSIAEYANWYGPSGSTSLYFGRLKGITDPTIGNHEYENGPGTGLLRLLGQRPALLQLQLGQLALHQPRRELPVRPDRARHAAVPVAAARPADEHEALHAGLLAPAAVQHRPGAARHGDERHLGAARRRAASTSSSTATTTTTSGGCRSTAPARPARAV